MGDKVTEPKSFDGNHRPCNLVTGALGFVGQHLVRSLVLAGHPVVGVDLHATDKSLPEAVGPFTLTGPVAGWPDAMEYTADCGRFFYVRCPLENPIPIARLMDGLRPIMVYHLAAQSSAAASFKDPAGTFAANVSKVTQTLLCRQYARSHEMPVIMTRSFSHSGPGHDTRFAFPHFARQIAAAEAGAGPAEITTGNLSAVRDFLDVRDVVAAYRLLLKEGRPGEIYHVSSGIPLTISQGLEILVDAAQCPLTIRRDPELNRPSDTPIMVGDNTKLRRETGWEPEWDFKDTLETLLREARKEFT